MSWERVVGSAYLMYSQSWIFLIHIDVSDDLRIFSMYTPQNPLEMQASSMADRPIREECKSEGCSIVMFLLESGSL